MHKPLILDPCRAALACIDLQEEHRGDPRYLVERYDAVLANVVRLQQAARAGGAAVLHFAYVVDERPGTMRPLHPRMPDGSSAFSSAGDPLTAICAEVAPAGAEEAYVKADASIFTISELAPRLRALGIEWLVVAGVWTEACIAASVKDAVNRGLRVLLVKDACGSASAAMHQTGILNLANRLYGGAVADTGQACRLLGGERLDAWQVEGSVPLRYSFETATALYDSL
jgi:nicotinamidase-related amidase